MFALLGKKSFDPLLKKLKSTGTEYRKGTSVLLLLSTDTELLLKASTGTESLLKYWCPPLLVCDHEQARSQGGWVAVAPTKFYFAPPNKFHLTVCILRWKEKGQLKSFRVSCIHSY